MELSERQAVRAAHAFHPRNWRRNLYVYPVCSRRSGGISLGVNLTPDGSCTYRCVYCQVQRGGPRPADKPADLRLLGEELTDMLALARSGRLFDSPEFKGLPANLQRVRDIAFSGDGEPTTCPRFAEAVERVRQLADAHCPGDLDRCAGGTAAGGAKNSGFDGVRLVLITNASTFDRPEVRCGLELLGQSARGEVWAKLDAGTEEYHRRVNRSDIPLADVVANIAWSARRRPIVIQSCFVRLDGRGPDEAELSAYCDRLAEVLSAGGQIRLVQVYTVARPPSETCVTALSRGQLAAIVRAIGRRFSGLAVAGFGGLAS